MFCPNCGTKNESTAEKCAQCGFDLRAKKPTPKFKGTVMMQQTPFAQGAGAEQKQSPGEQAAPAKTGLERPQAGQTGQTGVQKGPSEASSKLKGTMMGVAPPGMRDEIEKARRAAEAKKAAANVRTGADATTSPTPAKGAAGVASPGAAKASAGEAPSKLKGTMIGVAPPEMQGAIAEAQARMSGGGQSSATQQSGAPGAASGAEDPPEDRAPPSDPVNPLGGTVVGTSPFHRPEPAAAPQAGARGDQMPSAAAPAAAATGAGAAPQAPPTGEPDGTIEMTAAPEQRPYSEGDSASEQRSSEAPRPGVAPIGGGTADEPLDRSIHSIPGRKKSALPLILLLVAFVVAGGLLLLALMGGADGADDTAEDLVEDVAQPAKGEPTEK